MKIVNPFERTTWRNYPAPRLDDWMHEELRRIGGVVPYGEFKDKSILRFEWGQTEQTFRLGKMRLKYVNSLIPAIEKKNCYLWRTTHEFERFDDRGNPVYKKEIKRLDLAPKVIPAGWILQEDLPDLYWIGQQNFYIAQWIPPDLLGSENVWEKNRFDYWDNPESGKVEWTDYTGAFPRAGRWQPIAIVSEKRIAKCWKDNSFTGKRELVDVEVDFYAEPRNEHIEAVRRGWQERESERQKTSEEASKEAFYIDRINQDKAKRAAREVRAAQSREILGHYQPKAYQQTVDLSKLPTKHGKGEIVKKV